jgi:hypothetical protein
MDTKTNITILDAVNKNLSFSALTPQITLTTCKQYVNSPHVLRNVPLSTDITHDASCLWVTEDCLR